MRKNQIRQYINDLHTIAEVLEQHPDLPTPYFGAVDNSEPVVRFNFWGPTSAVEIAAGIRLFPGVKFTKNDPAKSGYDSSYYRLTGKFDVLSVEFLADRDTVCNRVVTGTETVTEELPDPELVAKLPTVKHDRVVETVEWQCVPLLAKAEAVAL